MEYCVVRLCHTDYTHTHYLKASISAHISAAGQAASHSVYPRFYFPASIHTHSHLSLATCHGPVALIRPSFITPRTAFSPHSCYRCLCLVSPAPPSLTTQHTQPFPPTPRCPFFLSSSYNYSLGHYILYTIPFSPHSPFPLCLVPSRFSGVPSSHEPMLPVSPLSLPPA